MNYTEDALVQQTTAEYLEKELGWESVYAYNTETFGPEGSLGRASDREVVLTRYLRRKLMELNPGLPEAAYDEAVRQVVAISAAQSLVATNREKYAQMLEGVQVTFRNDEGERVRERLQLFDFKEPANNHFLCVRELWVRGDLYRRRADIIGFVNGLPLLFIECKNIHKNLRTAYDRNISDYKDTIPHAFPPQRHHPAREWRRGGHRIGDQPLRAFPRVEAFGGRRTGRGGHGDPTKGGVRQTQFQRPVGELHPVR